MDGSNSNTASVIINYTKMILTTYSLTSNFKVLKLPLFVEARIWYEVAGGLAIYEGDVEQVKKYFSKCKELSPNSAYPILEIPEKAVGKAQEYYRKYLKEETP